MPARCRSAARIENKTFWGTFFGSLHVDPFVLPGLRATQTTATMVGERLALPACARNMIKTLFTL